MRRSKLETLLNSDSESLERVSFAPLSKSQYRTGILYQNLSINKINKGEWRKKYEKKNIVVQAISNRWVYKYNDVFNTIIVAFKHKKPRSMFSSWFNTNLPGSQPGLQKQNDLDTLINEVLRAVRMRLSEQLGQQIPEENLAEIKKEVSTSRRLEEELIETKAKYHELVQKLTLYQQNAKKIAASISSFVNSINGELKSEQLLIPLREIEKGISDMAAEKVEKHVNFLAKIYSSSFDDILRAKIRNKQAQFADEIQLVKNLNKNLEAQLLSTRTTKSQAQKKNVELSLKLAEATERLEQLQTNANNVVLHNDLREKYKTKEAQFVEQIKVLEKERAKLQQRLTEAQNQVVKSGTIVQKIKIKDEELMEDLKKEMKRKEGMYELSIKKAQAEKMHLQDQIQSLKEEIQAQKRENEHLEDQKAVKEAQALSGGKVVELEGKIRIIEDEKRRLQLQLQEQVGKEILRELFLRYDDESKEWSIRMDIRKQIYGLLGVDHKGKEGSNDSGKKWFGFF